MKYIIENDIDDIVAIYPDVFLVPFPVEHYHKKQSTGYNVLPVKFIDGDTLIGFCLVIEKKSESTLHCWIGGVLPKYRHCGVFSGFIDWIIKYGSEKQYKHITLNTDNHKPDILRLIIKRGFNIIGVEKTEYGDGNKVLLCFDIYPPQNMRLSITDQCNMDCFFCHSEGNFTKSLQTMPLSAIDQLLIQAQKLNFTEVTITGGEPLMYPEGVVHVLNDCSHWIHPPYIKICTNGILLDAPILQAIMNYSGKISLNVSMHAVQDNVIPKITNTHIKITEYDRMFSQLNKHGIEYRLNYVLLNGVNDSTQKLCDLFKYAMQTGIKNVHLLELLVTKKQTALIPYYISINEVAERINQLSDDFTVELVKKTHKKTEFLLKEKDDNTTLNVVLYRLSCRSGCERCNVDNDVKIGSDMRLHPCYIEDGCDCGDAVINLKHAIELRDTFLQNRSNCDSFEALYWGE